MRTCFHVILLFTKFKIIKIGKKNLMNIKRNAPVIFLNTFKLHVFSYFFRNNNNKTTIHISAFIDLFIFLGLLKDKYKRSML